MSKGLFHAIEAIIAVLILAGYFHYAGTFERVKVGDKVMVDYIALNSLLKSVNQNTYLKDLLFNKPHDMQNALSKIYGLSHNIYMSRYGLRPSFVSLLYVLPQSRKEEIILSPDSFCNGLSVTYSSQIFCYVNTSNIIGKNIMVVTYRDTRTGNNYLDMYIDYGNDGMYTNTDIFSSTVLSAGGKDYFVSEISYDKIVLWEVNDFDKKFIERLKGKVYNGINTDIYINTGTYEDAKYYDVILISNQSYFNGDYVTAFRDILSKGKSLILISNHTLSESISSLFEVYGVPFGLKNNNSVVCTRDSVENYEVNLFYNLHNSVELNYETYPNTISSDNLGDLISSGENKDDLREGLIDDNFGKYTFLIGSNTGNYNHIYIDFDKDGNFSESPDNISINIGNSFIMDGNNYTFIDSDTDNGNRITLLYNGDVCYNFSENSFNIYHVSNSSENVLLNYRGSVFCTNCSFNIGDVVDLPLTHVSGSVYKGDFVSGGVSHIFEINFSSLRLSIDIDGDGYINKPYELDMPIMSEFYIGSDKYVYKNLDVSSKKVFFYLKDRLSKPFAVYSNKGRGKAVFVVEYNESKRYFDLINLIIVWSSDREEKYYSDTSSFEDRVVVRVPVYNKKYFFEPFVFELRT